MDKYDEAIEYLRSQDDFREAVDAAWTFPFTEPGGCLFQYATPTGKQRSGSLCGCLVQVKSGWKEAYTDELTKQIREDTTLPANMYDITKENLSCFAYWRRKLDAMQ